jgi:hypothetical protein
MSSRSWWRFAETCLKFRKRNCRCAVYVQPD